MKLPKITIVTPNYNMAKYLEQTINSVLSQNYPNLEYIIIDGGSTDGSVEIIKKYEKQLAYWVSEKDDGLYSAIQKGFARSTGEIMAWLNSDDLYLPGALWSVAEIFGNYPQIQWLTGHKSIFDERGRLVKSIPSRRFCKYDFYQMDYQYIMQETTFWRRAIWSKAGGLDVKYKLAGDLELWLKFFRYEHLYVTEAPLGGFRLRRDNMSLQQGGKYAKEALEIINAETKLLNLRERALNYFCLFYKKIILAIPLLRRVDLLQNLYYKFTGVPPVLSFEREGQSIIFERKQ